MKLARIGYRLAVANAELCRSIEPGTGLVLHTPSQYGVSLRPAARRYFRFDGPVGVEGIVERSPAARADIAADDTLLAVGNSRFAADDPHAPPSTAALVEAADAVAALPPAAAMVVEGRRSGVDYVRTLVPVPACRTRFEVAVGEGYTAKADGTLVQIGSRFVEDYPEELMAVAVAHELAHNILGHRARLAAQGVSFGILSGLGANVRYFRQTELEADILSVALMANAGYDPEASERFWRTFGPSHASGPFRSRSHPAWRDRVATMERAIAELGPARPVYPKILETRDQPLDGDWQRLLVRAK